jgi:hypothetical protein
LNNHPPCPSPLNPVVRHLHTSTPRMKAIGSVKHGCLPQDHMLSQSRTLSQWWLLPQSHYVDLNRKASLHSKLIYCFIYKIHVTLIQVKKVSA